MLRMTEKNLGCSRKTAYASAAAMAFAIAVFGMVRHNLSEFGSLYLQSDDGDLYLSIARNFLQSGHFIQTARPIEAFVVPPGLPLTCTALLGLGSLFGGAGGTGTALLLAFQYAIYGLAASFMAMSALSLVRSAGFNPGLSEDVRPSELAEHHALFGLADRFAQEPPPKKSAFLLSRISDGAAALICGAGVPLLYLWCSFRIRHPNPGFVLTENYVLFLLALALWIAFSGKDERALCCVLFVLLLFRPACGGLFLCVFAHLLAKGIGKSLSGRRRAGNSAVYFGQGRRRASPDPRKYLLSLLAMAAVFAAVLGLNALVNFRETGHAIVLEDYGALDLYLANNPNAGPESYHSGKLEDFADERFREIYEGAGLTRFEQNELAKAALKEYIISNPGRFLRFAALRYRALFPGIWGALWYAFLGSAAALLLRRALGGGAAAFSALCLLMLTVPPSFGLLVERYSAPFVPLAAAFTAGAAAELISALGGLRRSEENLSGKNSQKQ